VKFQVIL